MAAWSQDIEILWEMCAFSSGKKTPYAEIFKILFQNFSSRQWSMLWCSNVIKLVRWEIGEIVHYLEDKKNKISPASQTVTMVQIVRETKTTKKIKNPAPISFRYCALV